MEYQSTQNQERAARGLRLVESHPDFGRMMDDEKSELWTAASDTIADILHALNAAGSYDDPAAALGPEDMLNRALWSYQGDFEDEPDREPSDASHYNR